MSEIVIKIESLSKLYRLGEVGTGTLSHDLNRWWARIRGKEDPQSLVGQVNDRTQRAESDYVWALKDVALEIQRGEVLGIIGKNGAGKSTLLKLISRITSPTTGSIKAKGRIASLLEVGTGMHPEMTARENVFLNGAIMGMKRYEIRERFDDIIDFAGCAMYIDTPIKRYSSGMRVRLGFAVAAFLEPEILIVDEVLAVGDAEFQKKATGKMKEISEGQGRTVLFVSHNMAAINKICNRGILVEQGKIACEGKAQEVVNAYLNQNIDSGSGVVKLKDGDDMAILEEAGVVNSQGDFSPHLAVDKNFQIKIQFSVKKTLDNAQLAVAITTTDGNVIFVTTNRDTNPQKRCILAPKTYCATVRIPGDFLNVGTYLVNLRIFTQTHERKRSLHASALQILRFTIHETGSIASILSDHRGGLVTPIFDWALE